MDLRSLPGFFDIRALLQGLRKVLDEFGKSHEAKDVVLSWMQRFELDKWSLLYSAKVPLVCALLAALVVLCILWTTHTRALAEDVDPATRFDALASVIVPTSYAHPKHYQKILAHTTTHSTSISTCNSSLKLGAPRTTLTLDFVDFWRNLALGRLELKDGSVLDEFVKDRVVVYGYAVRIDFGYRWIAEAMWKYAMAWMEYSTEGWMVGGLAGSKLPSGQKRIYSDIPNFNSCLVADTLDLDFIPIPYFTAALAASRNHITRTGRDAFDVEFTCLSSSTGFMSYGFLLCCAILLPNRHEVSRSRRTGLPFFVTFPAVVERLSALGSKEDNVNAKDAGARKDGETDAISVQSITDISTVHAQALDAHEQDMVHDQWTRGGFIGKHGIDAWRETRLRLRWEAALLRCKVLERWKVTLVASEAKQCLA